MQKSYFDQRRPLSAPIGLPASFRQTSVIEAPHRALLEDAEAMRLLESDTTPIPAADAREGYYGNRHLEYWLSGLCDWRNLRPYVDGRKSPRYMDMGGSTGRVVRHAARHADVECWLSDININWIDWMDRHFTYPVTAYQSRIYPSVPAEDRTFDLISAFSVFTHLDCDANQWLLELRRVLKPGGHLYITVNDENVWDKLKNPNWYWLRDKFSRGNRDAEFAAMVERLMPDERFVWEYSSVESYNINVFLASAYVKRVWGRYFEIASYLPHHHGYQSVVVLRKF